jgi:hypothetical protein
MDLTGPLFVRFILPLAVILSSAAASAASALALRLYRKTSVHERALFGEEDVAGHDGIIKAVNNNSERSEENRKRSERNRRVLRSNGLVRGHSRRSRSSRRRSDADDDR